MAIGSRQSEVQARSIGGFRGALRWVYGRVYGDSDLHTHVRWQAIQKRVVAASAIVDVACGDGTITMEVARRLPGASIVGIDLNAAAIESARRSSAVTATHNVEFRVGNIEDLEFGHVDQALLLDVLEHVDDDQAVLAAISGALQSSGRVLISTPTPNYPRWFGQEFHVAVGHVRAGYTAEQLTRMVGDAGLRVVSTEHYTRLPASVCCALYYRWLWNNRLGFVLSPLLYAIARLDSIYPWDRGASSVLIVAAKPEAGHGELRR